jgi:hypothetical protein
MYPQAETADGRLDSLDPDGFKYEIKSRETTAANSCGNWPPGSCELVSAG